MDWRSASMPPHLIAIAFVRPALHVAGLGTEIMVGLVAMVVAVVVVLAQIKITVTL